MNAKTIIEQAARRAATRLIHAANCSVREDQILLPDFMAAEYIAREFGWIEGLIEAASKVVVVAKKERYELTTVGDGIRALITELPRGAEKYERLAEAIAGLRRYVSKRGKENQKRATTIYGPDSTWHSAKADTYKRIEAKLDELITEPEVVILAVR
jgi:hypothetical protein